MLSLASPAAPATELDALIERLARPTPTETGFVERRESALLDAPLLSRGRLLRPESGTLVRQVDSPRPERTTIRRERVTVERDGRRVRSFALQRAPELAALLASFQAMLDGDRAALERHYEAALNERDGRWTITLLPRSAALQQQLGQIELHGRDDQLQCIATAGGRGGDSLMLVGSAAEAADPDFDLCGSGH